MNKVLPPDTTPKPTKTPKRIADEMNVVGTETGRIPSTIPATSNKPSKGRGFSSMDPERQREIARLGGIFAHQSGHAHEFTPEEAREAAMKSVASRRANSPKKVPK